MVSETRQDPERIYLEPAPYSPEGRLWCATDAQSNVWSIIRSALSRAWALSRPWAVAGRPQVTSEVVARLDAIAAECEREVLTALRSDNRRERA